MEISMCEITKQSPILLKHIKFPMKDGKMELMLKKLFNIICCTVCTVQCRITQEKAPICKKLQSE